MISLETSSGGTYHHHHYYFSPRNHSRRTQPRPSTSSRSSSLLATNNLNNSNNHTNQRQSGFLIDEYGNEHDPEHCQFKTLTQNQRRRYYHQTHYNNNINRSTIYSISSSTEHSDSSSTYSLSSDSDSDSDSGESAEAVEPKSDSESSRSEPASVSSSSPGSELRLDQQCILNLNPDRPTTTIDQDSIRFSSATNNDNDDHRHYHHYYHSSPVPSSTTPTPLSGPLLPSNRLTHHFSKTIDLSGSKRTFNIKRNKPQIGKAKEKKNKKNKDQEQRAVLWSDNLINSPFIEQTDYCHHPVGLQARAVAGTRMVEIEQSKPIKIKFKKENGMKCGYKNNFNVRRGIECIKLELRFSILRTRKKMIRVEFSIF